MQWPCVIEFISCHDALSDQDMSKIFGLNLPVFGVVVGSVGVVLIALTAGLVVCCCRKKPNSNTSNRFNCSFQKQ